MSGLYEALKQAEKERGQSNVGTSSGNPADLLKGVVTEGVNLDLVTSVKVKVPFTSRLVALTDARSLGAEKFRALATRLENSRWQRELKSLQVTSSVISEGKSLVASNLAIAFAQGVGSKVLLIDGDFHRPTLASLFGLEQSRGTGDWWAGSDQDISRFLLRLNDMHLWFLPAGKPHDQPSDILQSRRFGAALNKLAMVFDWVVVDSPPMLPVVDVNLWSRLLDGTLLVVREGVAPVKALKKGLEALDNPKMVGIVLNESSEFNRGNYKYSYYGSK